MNKRGNILKSSLISEAHAATKTNNTNSEVHIVFDVQQKWKIHSFNMLT